VYFVVKKSLCPLRSLWLKRSPLFGLENHRSPSTWPSPPGEGRATARCYYSVACLADPDMGISKAGGDSDRGIGDRGIKFTYPYSSVASGAGLILFRVVRVFRG
jgi:hypothetical protein